jgi:electron transport complex protein RnfA
MRYGAILAAFGLGGNVVLAGLMGVCPALSLRLSGQRALSVGCFALVVSCLTVCGLWVVDRLVLAGLGARWLALAVGMLLATGCAFAAEALVRALSPALDALVHPHTAQTALGAAVLGVALAAVGRDYTFMECFVAGVGGGGGFLLTGLVMASIHLKLELEEGTRAFRGLPAALVSLALLALAILGLRGMGG